MYNFKLTRKLIEQNLSQIELAHMIGIDDGYLSNIIRGWRYPSEDLKEKIAGKLDADACWLFGANDEVINETK